MVPDLSALSQQRPEGKSREDCSSLLLAPFSPSLGDFQLLALGRWAAGRQELGPPGPRDSPLCSPGLVMPREQALGAGSHSPCAGAARGSLLFIPAGALLLIHCQASRCFKVSSFYRTLQCPQARGIRMQKVLVLQSSPPICKTSLGCLLQLVLFYFVSAMISTCWGKCLIIGEMLINEESRIFLAATTQ